jgi:hypothetical protein
MMKSINLAIALSGLLILILGAAPAWAKSGNGATVIDVDTCVPLIGGDGIVCVQTKGVINEVMTPSGNESYVSNYREAIQVIEDGVTVYEETSREHFHSLTRDNLLREMSWRARFTISNLGETFCITYHFHGTNGEDQYARIDFCS